MPVRGRGALGLWWHRHAGGHARNLRVNMVDGYVMRLPSGARQTWIAAFTGRYEVPVGRVMKALMRPEMLAVDVGASLGLHTVPLGARAREIGAAVVAFEPVGASYAVLARNVAMNDLSSVVEVRQTALGRCEGWLEMRGEHAGGGNAAIVSGLAPAVEQLHVAQGGLGRPMTVRVNTLDAEMKGDSRRCSLIKMDVEGWEFDVLAGARGYVAEHRPAIVGEFSSSWLRTRNVSWPEALWRWAEEMDYAVYEIRGARVHRWQEALNPIVRSLAGGETPRSDLLLHPRRGLAAWQAEVVRRFDGDRR